jgi:hypothetical protein
MWHSVESRTPFADDIHLIENTFSIPGSYKMHGNITKKILREATKDILPSSIYNRKDKMGYVTPNNKWLLGNINLVKQVISETDERYINKNVLLKELDTRIQEATSKIDEARAKNNKTVKLSILTPALQYLLGPTPTAGKPQEGNGLIDNLLGIVNGKTGLINGLINVIGVPLFTASQGTNTEANRNAIAISDLQIKVAELQRARAQLADTIREKVAVALVKFDEGRTDFQIAQVVGARAIDQFKVFELRYIRGNNDTEGYLAKQSELDKVKANTYGSWGKMRRFLRSASLSLFEIKLLVLGVKNAEI